MEWSAIWLTLRLAMVVCAVLLVVGTPIAAWLAFTRWRWKFLLEAVVALPLVLPPTVLGFYILVAIGANSPVGSLYHRVFGHRLPFTFTSLAIASVIYSLPFAVQPMVAAFSGVDRELLSASAILGASPLRTFARIVMPLSKSGIITGAVLSFAHTLGEFGVVLMVGGNIPGVTRTVSIAIYDHVEALDYASANQMALLLMAFSFIALSLTYAVNRRVWAVWPLHR
ncbi:MAG TPA: molybdate ABC transporter permease subunit [Candidatus Binataceae bacterium]|jgi:molybdate transport system permease protein|nr:molybdate ABC transporter permease subunit [Candidatus Binataceae bacterium]